MRNYRGKRVDNGEWLYGDLIHNNEQVLIKPIFTEPYEYDEDFDQNVHPETVGQAVLVEGTEYYEGDLLKVSIHDHNTGKIIAQQTAPIEFRTCKYGVMFGRDFTAFDGFTRTTFEKVGTIYDPELLEVRV